MMNTKKIIQNCFVITAVALVLIQFVRPTKNDQSAESANDIGHVVNVPQNIKLILKSACYDCHSNYTEYPWYAEIMPIGLWLNHHVEEGKEHLNFSEFATYSVKRQDHKLEETAEEVGEQEMPLSSYTIIHRDTKLTAAQIEQLVSWVGSARAEINYTETK